LFHVAQGGANNTTYVWVFTYPLISLFLLGSGLGSLASFLLLGLMCIVFAIGDRVACFTSYKADLILRLITSYITVTLIALVMERVRHITQNRLRISNTKLEEAVKSLEQAHNEKDSLILELQQTIDEVKTLQGIIPICASCKKIRDDSGYWQQVEAYVKNHSDAEFSHGICPECVNELYPDLYDED
jgi:membrane protein implicated in regulation of membrane protease activity